MRAEGVVANRILDGFRCRIDQESDDKRSGWASFAPSVTPAEASVCVMAWRFSMALSWAIVPRTGDLGEVGVSVAAAQIWPDSQ
jgi:hypothetical protein